MYNICMLQYSKIVMFKLTKLGISFLSLMCPCMLCSKRKIYKESQKAKRIKNAFEYGCKPVSRRCGSYRMYLEGDSSHQAVMVMCKWIWFSWISNCHNMRHLCTLAMFSHTTHKFFTTFDTCAGTMWFGYHKEHMC